MKKMAVFALAVFLAASLCACGAPGFTPTPRDINGKELSEKDVIFVNKAIRVVNSAWNMEYSDLRERGRKTDRTVEIINTRIIRLKDNDVPELEGAETVVEFDILSDLYGSAPCYANAMRHDTVVFYEDGSTRDEDLLRLYGNSVYYEGLDGIIEEVVECGDAFNTSKIKRAKVSDESDEYVSEAIEALSAKWAINYDKTRGVMSREPDGTVRIIHTRLLTVKDESQYPQFEKYFGGVEAIVEFELYSDYFATAPYYQNVGTDGSVIFYEDGTVEVRPDYVHMVRATTFETDVSDAFDEVLDFGSAYDTTLDISEL